MPTAIGRTKIINWAELERKFASLSTQFDAVVKQVEQHSRGVFHSVRIADGAYLGSATTPGAVSIAVDGTITLATVIDAAADVDRFLVLDAGNRVDYRTGNEVLDDIGGPDLVSLAGLNPGAGDVGRVIAVSAANTYTLAAGPPPAAHDILSASHGDSLAAGVSRGSLIVGNATPAWSELVIGAAGTLLRSDGTDAAWTTLAGAGIQPLDADLTAIAALVGTGILCHTAADTWAERTMAAPAAGFTITNPGGVAGNPTFALADDLAALEAMAGTGIVVRTAANTYAQRTVTSTAGFSITNAGGVAGNIDVGLTTDTPQFARLGLGCAADGVASLSLNSVADATGNILTIYGDVVNYRTPAEILGDVGGQPLDATLTSIAALGTGADKIAYTTGVDTWAETTLTAFARTILDDANQAAAQATLGVVPGTDVQVYDAFLTSIAALGTGADKMVYTTGVDTAAETSLTAFARTILDDANQGAVQTTLGLVPGTDVQVYDATLTSIAALGTGADKIAYTTGVDTWAETTLTAFARTILDDANAATVLTTIGAATAAHLHDGNTLQHDGVNSNGGAFSFTTTGAVTFNQDVYVDNPMLLVGTTTAQTWKTATYESVIQVGVHNAIASDSNNEMNLVLNAYYDITDSRWERSVAAGSSRIELYDYGVKLYGSDVGAIGGDCGFGEIADFYWNAAVGHVTVNANEEDIDTWIHGDTLRVFGVDASEDAAYLGDDANETEKHGYLRVTNYDVTNEPEGVSLLYAYSTNIIGTDATYLYIGGGDANANAVSAIRLYAASGSETRTGTLLGSFACNSLTWNPDGGDIDWLVKSNDRADMLGMDAAANKLFINGPIGNGILTITQDDESGEACLVLDQDDISEGFIDFVGSDRGIITTVTTNSVASVRAELNGTKYLIALFEDA